MSLLSWPFLAAYALFLRWCIWEAEHHLRECARDGLIESLSLREFRGQIAADRIRLCRIHARTDEARAKGARLLRRFLSVFNAAAGNAPGRRFEER